MKIKKADNLSTLKEKDKNGKDELKLYENSEPKNKTDKEDDSPAIDPRIAKVFPQKLANLLFFMKTKDPNAPSNNKDSDAKNKTCVDNRKNIKL